MDTETVHEAVQVAKLGAAQFIINHFDCNATQQDKPEVYKAAIEYISAALKAE